MNALDQPTAARLPATWTADLVRKRLVDAFDIEEAITRPGP